MVRLTHAQLEKNEKFITDYINASNAADGSKMDANANVSHKNLATLSAEIHKGVNIQINRKRVQDKIKELYSEELSLEYVRQLESGEIYCHDETSILPYCVSISMYPFLTHGLTLLGGESKAPKHLNSFCGNFVNLIFSISSQFAGAVAAVEFLMCFDYFARKDYGDDYLNTHASTVANALQHVVYALNQPSASSGYQSVFWNLSLYDEPYFNAMFENFVFPDKDFTKPSYESLSKLQEYFLKWINVERTKAILTFPVITAACLTDGKKPVDTKFEELLSSELANGNSFFIFMSDNPASLSSCCRLKNLLDPNEAKIKKDIIIQLSDNTYIGYNYDEKVKVKYNGVEKIIIGEELLHLDVNLLEIIDEK